jgi:murein DD-endopeptidase MepM/ murein hydrolase activator NlpD
VEETVEAVPETSAVVVTTPAPVQTPPSLQQLPTVEFSSDSLTAVLRVPHGTPVEVAAYQEWIEALQPGLADSVLSPDLPAVADDSLRAQIRTIILRALPPYQRRYRLAEVAIDDSTTTITYRIDRRALTAVGQPIVETYRSPAQKPPYPLFATATQPPTAATFDSLKLLLPCAAVPVPQKAVLLPNAPRSYRHGIHRGIDFFVNWGTPVRAVADGVVIRADHHFTEVEPRFRERLLEETKQLGRTPSDIFEHVLVGRAVYIDHGFALVPGYRAVTIYAHLSSINPDLLPGTAVTRGQIIGHSGNSGTQDSTMGLRKGAHLHWELILQNRTGEYYLGQGLPYSELYPLLLRIFAPDPVPAG